MRFRRIVPLLCVIACLTSAAAARAKSTKKEAAAPGVRGAGCIEPGVEAGCLMVKDEKTGTDYNVFFKGKKPRLYTAISFEGEKHDGPATCMQGTAVVVSKWRRIKMQCENPKK